MTTNHPVPTPPPSEPAPSLRPVEEPCGFAIIDDGEVRPCERPATGWRWYQDCGHEDMLAAACDQHENEGGRRLRAAEETLAEMAPLLIARSDSESLIEGLEKVRRRLCHYGPAALTCDCKYGASFKGEQGGCPELRRAIAALAEGASR